MTTESLLLIGRDTRTAREDFRVHADRLRGSAGVDDVDIALYEEEPVRELRDRFVEIDDDVVYAVPMCAAHSHDTLDAVPSALSYVEGEVRYCEPVGRSPAVTDVLEERAAASVPPDDDAAIAIVAFGSSSKPHHRRTAEFHAERLRERSGYGQVHISYLVQNPAVECARYAIEKSRAVAVPLFVTRSPATEERIPAALELDRGGLEYAPPLGSHPRVTDAIRAEVERRRALAADPGGESTLEEQVTRSRRPVATDGEGVGER
ncbi:CbiX/SirB N-terminal domain-containing protein [Halopenitus salinus]|uniref:CbiX/SirB N-terminal domain-containing protein n=1 Tax=Halopenitus salinus TaxID=1198295 RepID=A0ABD5UW48_9EURY